MSQNKLLLAALKREPWTTGELFIHLGIGRPASRVNELREHHDIYTEMITIKNRHGDNIRVGKYHYRGKLKTQELT